MGYTVTLPYPTKDAEFEAYTRLLRQQGKNLGHLERVPDPLAPRRRWVYVWPTQEEAQQFADELIQQTGEQSWRVEPTDAPPSEGPFGPVLFQLIRRSDGLILALHPLSRAMIHSAFPQARSRGTNAFIDTQTWQDFVKAHGSVNDLLVEIMPGLSGLKSEDLFELGYAVIDSDDDRTYVYQPPAGVAQAQP